MIPIVVPVVYPSSGEFWKHADPKRFLNNSLNYQFFTDLPNDFKFCVDAKAASEVAEILGVSTPLHLTAPHQNFKRRTPDCVVQMYPKSFLPDSFLHIRRSHYDIFIASPALSFLLAARLRSCDLIDLVKFGYDLCAQYYQVPGSKFGQMPRKPITSTKSLRDYLNINHGSYGTATALKALSFVSDFSNSPMETKIAMFSVLPSKIGGCAYDNPEMNKVIKLTEEGKNLVGLSEIRGDLVFGKTVVDYNSNAVHLNSANYTEDMNRQTAIKLAGYNYIAITAGNIKNFYSFMNVMNAISTALKKPKLEETAERKTLYFRLFDKGRY